MENELQLHIVAVRVGKEVNVKTEKLKCFVMITHQCV